MFNNPIRLIEKFPESYHKKVCIRDDGFDDTLFMTASILLYNRVDNLKIEETLTRREFNPDCISTDPNVFSFHWFENVSSNPDELLKPVKDKFKKIDKLPTHEKFLSDQLKQSVYIRLMPEENTVCLFTKTITFPVYHCTQFFIPKYFKVFKEKPLPKEEISFLETLTYKTSTNYVKKLTELANSESFARYLLKDQLAAFEKKLFERKVQAAKNSLDSIEEKMRIAMQDYMNACNKRIEAMALVDGLKTMADQTEEHTELQEYLINNPRICNVSLDESYISFIAKTYLSPHHIDEWEIITQRKQIFDQYRNNKFPDRDDIKLLLDAIFSENRCLKLKMCAYFKMDYFGSQVNSRVSYNYIGANKDLANYIPNPHLYHHNCFGQNKLAIIEQLTSGDAVGAIECAIACTQRINIHESMTFKPFVDDLLSSTGKCLVASDGTEMTVTEAVKYLKGQNNG